MVKQILLLCGEYNLKSACVCGVEDVIDTVLDKRHLTDKYDFRNAIKHVNIPCTEQCEQKMSIKRTKDVFWMSQ